MKAKDVHNLLYIVVLLIVTFIIPEQAHAYVGPGAGLSFIGMLVAIIGAFFLLIVGFIWYPVKRLLQRKKAAGKVEHDKPENSDP